MKAAFYLFKEKKFIIKETLVPKLKSDEVLVKIKTSAICGTDLHIMDKTLIDKAYNKTAIIIGHEWVGTVEKIGKDIKRFKAGDRIFGSPHIPCGQCKNCLSGHENWCDKQAIYGLSRPGSHAEYLAAPERTVYKLPKNINFITGVLLGDMLGTAYHAIKKAGLASDDKIIILGLGPIGMLIGYLAKLLKIKKIYAYDPIEYRVKLAKKLFNFQTLDISDFSKFKKTFPVVFEASGSAQALKHGFNLLSHGGRFILVGVHSKKYQLDSLRLMYRELSVLGCFGYPHSEALEFIKMTNSRRLCLQKIITHNFKLQDINKAYSFYQTKQSGKIILNI